MKLKIQNFSYIFLTRISLLKGTTTQHSGHMGQVFQTELMVEIYSKSRVRAIGKVLLLTFS